MRTGPSIAGLTPAKSQLAANQSEVARSYCCICMSIMSQASAGEGEAISIAQALRIPGVIEFSLCLFFSKLVSYTFLDWLPYYIANTRLAQLI